MFSERIIYLTDDRTKGEKTEGGEKKSTTGRQSFICFPLVHPQCTSLFGSATEWTTESFSRWRQMIQSRGGTAHSQLCDATDDGNLKKHLGDK